MKTPQHIAQATLDDLAIKPHWNRNGEQMLKIIQHAIEADRAQRDPNDDGTLHGATILALKDRVIYNPEAEQALTKAIEFIETDPDDFWDEFAGPMLDDLVERFES